MKCDNSDLLFLPKHCSYTSPTQVQVFEIRRGGENFIQLHPTPPHELGRLFVEIETAKIKQAKTTSMINTEQQELQENEAREGRLAAFKASGSRMSGLMLGEKPGKSGSNRSNKSVQKRVQSFYEYGKFQIHCCS